MLRNLFMSLVPNKTKLEMFTYSVKSDNSINFLTEKFTNICSKYNFVLLNSYNYHEIVEAKGFPINKKVYIYEICQAKVASMMLDKNPYFAPFMPCRIAIYEENNECIISTQNMTIMFDMIKEQTELHSEATILFDNLKNMMNNIN